MLTNENFAELLLQARKHSNWTPARLNIFLAFPQGRIEQLEKGEEPTHEEFTKVSDFIDLMLPDYNIFS